MALLCRGLTGHAGPVEVGLSGREGGDSQSQNQCDWWTCVAVHVVSAQDAAEETVHGSLQQHRLVGCTKTRESRLTSVSFSSKVVAQKAPLTDSGESFHSQLVTILFDLGGGVCRLKLRTGEKIPDSGPRSWCEVTKAGEPKGASVET